MKFVFATKVEIFNNTKKKFLVFFYDLIPPEPSYKKNGVAHMGELLVADRLALN
jgi:hypothetical protein